MKINTKNPGHLKLAILCDGIQLDANSRKKVGKKFAENCYPYGRSNVEDDGLETLPSEIMLPEDVSVGVHLNKLSPWSIKVNNIGNMELFHNNVLIAPVEFSPRPLFFDKRLRNGKLIQEAVVMYGKYSLSLFNRGWCHYFMINKPCRFCSLNPTRDDVGGGNVKIITKEIAEEAARMAFLAEPHIKHVDYCAGAHAGNDIGIKMQMELIKIVKQISPRGIVHHLLTIPPDSLKLIHELKSTGLDSIAFNIEVYDRQLFNEICPGKEAAYGYEKYFRALKEAKNVFGVGNVYCGFVGGLEPIESIVAGIKEVGEMGYVPAINVFHPDPESEYHDKARPSKEYIYELTKVQSGIYQKNNFQPIFPGGTRNSLDTEVWRGFFT